MNPNLLRGCDYKTIDVKTLQIDIHLCHISEERGELYILYREIKYYINTETAHAIERRKYELERFHMDPYRINKTNTCHISYYKTSLETQSFSPPKQNNSLTELETQINKKLLLIN